VAMTNETITQRELESLAAGGLVNTATAVGDGDQWSLVLSIGKVNRTLTAINSGSVRNWSKLDSLYDYVSKYGIRDLQINGQGFNKSLPSKKRKRPDAANALRHAHAAAEHDTYMKAEIDKSLELIASGEAIWIPHEQVKKEMKEYNANLLAKHSKKPTN